MRQITFSLIGLLFLFTGLSPALASHETGPLPLLQKLESCQQNQYQHLQKLHLQLSHSAHLSSLQLEKAKKKTKIRARESALLSLDSTVLALINEVVLDQEKSIRFQKKLKKSQAQIPVEQFDELSQFAELVDQNFHEVAQKSFMLKIKDDREFQSCVTQAAVLKAGV